MKELNKNVHGQIAGLLLMILVTVTVTVSLSAMPAPQPKFAVVVVGANTSDPESMHIAFANTGDRVYSTLKAKNYSDANILYLSWDLGNPNVDFAATKANIQWGLQTWLWTNLNNLLQNETVVIYFIDHGGVNGNGYFFVANDNFVYDYELSLWVNSALVDFNGNMNYLACNIVIETCYSGLLIGPTTVGLSGGNRIVVTSTDTFLQAYSWWAPPQIWFDSRPADSNGEAIFSYYYLKQILAGKDVQAAFNRSYIQTVNEVNRLALLSGGNEQQNPLIDNLYPGQLFW